MTFSLLCDSAAGSIVLYTWTFSLSSGTSEDDPLPIVFKRDDNFLLQENKIKRIQVENTNSKLPHFLFISNKI